MLNVLPKRVRSWIVKSFATDFMRALDIDEGGTGTTPFFQPMRQSAWIFAAINCISGEMTGRPLKFYLGDEEYEDAQLAAWWSKPAIGADQQRIELGEVIEILVTWWKLKGENFLILDDTWLTIRAGAGRIERSPFIIARPDAMQEIVHGNQLEGWRYTDAGGQQHTLLREQVIFRKRFNPYSQWRGLAAADAVRLAAEADYLAGAYVRDLMRNNGDQGAIVSPKDGSPITDPQKEQIIAALRERRARIRRGDLRDFFLTANVNVAQPEARSADASLQGTRIQSREEIFVGLGVPPSLAQVKATYSTGMASDRYALISGQCQPLGDRMAGVFGMLASRQTGRELTGELDWDNHPVMQEVRAERLKSVDVLWAKGVPMSEINDYLDLGLSEYEGWEVGYLPFSVVPVAGESGQSPAASGQPGGTDPATSDEYAEPVDPEVEKIQLVLLAKARAAKSAEISGDGRREEFAAFTCRCGAEHGMEMIGHAEKDRDPKEVARWREQMAQRREAMKAFKTAFTRVLMEARTETLKKLATLSDAKVAEIYTTRGGFTDTMKAAAADYVFDLSKFREKFRAAMRGRQADTLAKAGEQFLAELGKDDPFTMAPAAVLQFQAQRENRLSGVPDSIHERIKASIAEALDKGESTAKIAARVRTEFNGVEADRALTIAQTEVSAAYGYGRQQAMQTAGIKWKRWLTSGNDNVRSAHAAANGQTVPIDQPFIVDGEELMHPGDENGSPGNTINCHCVSIAVESEDAD